MLTTKQFNDWLYNIKGDDNIVLCQGAIPDFFCQTVPGFALVYRRALEAAEQGFVYINPGRHNSWVAQRHITPKRELNDHT